MPEVPPKSNNPLNPYEAAESTNTTSLRRPAKAAPQGGSSNVGMDQGPRKHHWILWVFLLLLVIGGVYLYRQREAAAQSAKAAASQGPRPVLVTTATATKGDIGVYVSAPATVTPIYTVTVTGRVQGEIIALNYQEGQMVHKGDALIDIDARPYQAQLTQTEGQLAHDQAVLEEAKIDLTRYQEALRRNAIEIGRAHV